MLLIITVTGDHFFEQATNRKSKPLYNTMGVCNFTKVLLEVAQNKRPSGCQALLKNHPYDPTSKFYHFNFG